LNILIIILNKNINEQNKKLKNILIIFNIFEKIKYNFLLILKIKLQKELQEEVSKHKIPRKMDPRNLHRLKRFTSQ
jgi:putative cell wall-binding protein